MNRILLKSKLLWRCDWTLYTDSAVVNSGHKFNGATNDLRQDLDFLVRNEEDALSGETGIRRVCRAWKYIKLLNSLSLIQRENA